MSRPSPSPPFLFLCQFVAFYVELSKCKQKLRSVSQSNSNSNNSHNGNNNGKCNALLSAKVKMDFLGGVNCQFWQPHEPRERCLKLKINLAELQIWLYHLWPKKKAKYVGHIFTVISLVGTKCYCFSAAAAAASSSFLLLLPLLLSLLLLLAIALMIIANLPLFFFVSSQQIARN